MRACKQSQAAVVACLAALVVLTRAQAEPPRATLALAPEGGVQHLDLAAAVDYALKNNPEIAAVREGHGIAAAGVVIARTYPFNPTFESVVRYANGPNSAGVTNPVPFDTVVLLEWEVMGQGRYRRAQAVAALSRTDAEIAYQEMSLAVRVVRAFNTSIYRRDKLRLAQEVLQLDEDTAKRVRRLMEHGRGVRPADLNTALTEAAAARALIGPARVTAIATGYDLNRLLGIVNEPVEPEGMLPPAPRGWQRDALVQAALEQRPDLRARQAAVAEAGAALQLEVANRLGNPTFGPSYTYDPTEIQMVGAQFNVPLPLLNRHRGEIMQREAQQGQSILQLRQSEIQVRQDVDAALAHLEQARRALETYENEVIPELQRALTGMEQLFESAEVDALHVIDVRRKLIQARDGVLDARWDVSEALAELAAAVGDPALAICVPAEPAGPATPAP